MPLSTDAVKTDEVEAFGVDLTGLGVGMVQVTEGRAPRTGSDGIAVTGALADRLDLQIGDTATVAGTATSVVGIVRDPIDLDRQTVVVAPDAAPAATGLLVALPPDTDADELATKLKDGGWDAITRDEVAREFPEQVMLVVILGGFGLLVTGLVTAAAFAVSAQRRRHELALLAATGAEPRHLRRSVIASAFILGILGATAGLSVGLAVAAALLPRLEDWTGLAVDGLAVSVAVLVTMAAVGVGTAVAASWLTARAAGRTPVAAALTGRRPPRTSSTRLLIAGLATTALGIAAATVAMALAGDSGNEVLAGVGLSLGAGLVMVGLGALSPWLVERAAGWFGASLPVGIRLALRDTARFRSRTAPIVIAIVAGLGISVAVGTTLDMIERSIGSTYRPLLSDDQLLVDGNAPAALVNQLRDNLPVAAAAPVIVTQPVGESASRPLPQFVTIADPRLLDALAIPPAAAAALTAGDVLVLVEPDRAADTDRLVDQPPGTRPVGWSPSNSTRPPMPCSRFLHPVTQSMTLATTRRRKPGAGWSA